MAQKLVRISRKAAPAKRSRTSDKAQSFTDLTMEKPGHKENRLSLKDGGFSLADRIQAEREQLFKAISLVECCKYASATLLEIEAPEYIVGVYDLLSDLLDSCAGGLGCIAEGCRDVPKV